LIYHSSPLTHNPSFNWYVLYTKSRQEKKVAEKLMELNIEAYCPTRIVSKVWSDRTKRVEEPLFKSYCFVRVSDTERELVFQATGVVRYLFWLGKPAIVKDTEIDTIKKWLNEFDQSLITVGNLLKGDTVEIKNGVLIGEIASVQEKRGKIVTLNLKSLGATITLDLTKNLVESTNEK
jgi:transcription antitermination factor NusG